MELWGHLILACGSYRQDTNGGICNSASLFSINIVAEFPLPYTNSGSSLDVSGWGMAVSTR